VKEDNRRPFERPSFDDVQRTVANGDVGGRNAASPAVVELSSCGVVVMGYTLIQQKELRNQVGQVLRRVEAGESLIVTVSGRPVAELSPVRRHRWVSGPAVTRYGVVRHRVPWKGILDDSMQAWSTRLTHEGSA